MTDDEIGELWMRQNANMSESDRLSEDEFLESILGPKHLPLKLVVPVSLVYASIFVTGVFGNAVTCAVIVRNAAMQTATNRYLFSLAVSDLMLLVLVSLISLRWFFMPLVLVSLICLRWFFMLVVLGLPNELWVFWQQYPWELGLTVCKGRAFVSEMSSYVSVLTIVAFSLERYFAICHPLRLYAMSGLKRHLFVIVAAWIVALLFALPFCWYTELYYVEWPPRSRNVSRKSTVCAMFNMPNFPLYETSCLIFFLVPMLIIVWLYARMGIAIRSTSLGRRIDGTIHGETRASQSRKAIVRMLGAVVLAFFVCWAPFHAQRLLYVYAERDTFARINEWLYPLAGALYYLSTAVNPILYNLMSAKYRRAFGETLRCSSRTPSRLLRTEVLDASGGSFRNSQIIRLRALSSHDPSLKCRRSVDYQRRHSHHSPTLPSSPRADVAASEKSSTIEHSRNDAGLPDRIRGKQISAQTPI